MSLAKDSHDPEDLNYAAWSFKQGKDFLSAGSFLFLLPSILQRELMKKKETFAKPSPTTTEYRITKP